MPRTLGPATAAQDPGGTSPATHDVLARSSFGAISRSRVCLVTAAAPAGCLITSHAARRPSMPSCPGRSGGRGCWTGARGTTPGRSRSPLCLFAAGWAAFALVGDSWWHACGRRVPGGHVHPGRLPGARRRAPADPARTEQASYIIWASCAATSPSGMSYGWWAGQAQPAPRPPQPAWHADPDIMLSVLAFTGAQARTSRGRDSAGAPLTRHTCSSRCCSWRRSACMSRACAR